MGEPLRVGLIGAGYIAKPHSIGYANARGIYGDEVPEIVRMRVADVDPDMAKAAAARWGWQEATPDWRAITRADDIDLVDIVTPNFTHAEIALDALAHGKHVICEKPIAPDSESADRMYRAAVEAGVVHQVGFYYRLWPAVALARLLIDEGRIGKLLHFRGRFFQDYARDPELPISWRFQRDKAGAGALGDIGSHILDIARYLAGDIVSVCATTRSLLPERPGPNGTVAAVDVDDLAQLLLEFEGGASGSVEASWAANGFKCDLGFDIVGERGGIRFSWEHNNALLFYSDDDDPREAGFRQILLGGQHPNAEPFWHAQGQGLGYGDAFIVGVGHALRAIAAGRTAEPDFLSGLRTCEVVEAALESAANRAWTPVTRHPALEPVR